MPTQPHTLAISLIALALAQVATPALAYAGPGAGLSMIGSLVALVVALLAALFGFVWFPVKRMLRNRKADQTIESSKASIDSQR